MNKAKHRRQKIQRLLQTVLRFVGSIGVAAGLTNIAVSQLAPSYQDATHIYRHQTRGAIYFMNDWQEHLFWICGLTFVTAWVVGAILTAVYYWLRRIDDREAARELAEEVWNVRNSR